MFSYFQVLMFALLLLSCSKVKLEEDTSQVYKECRNQWRLYPYQDVVEAFERLPDEHRDADSYLMIRSAMADKGYFDGLFFALAGSDVIIYKSVGSEVLSFREAASEEVVMNFELLEDGVSSKDYSFTNETGLHPTCKFIDVKLGGIHQSFSTTYSSAWMDEYMIKDLNVELSKFDRAIHYFLRVGSVLEAERTGEKRTPTN